MHTGAMGTDSFPLEAAGFAPFFRFLWLTRALLTTLDFFGEERFFLFRAVKLTAEIIDLRLQIAGLRPLGRRTASNWRIRVLTRFCGFLQRSNLLLIGIQLRLQIGFLFL